MAVSTKVSNFLQSLIFIKFMLKIKYRTSCTMHFINLTLAQQNFKVYPNTKVNSKHNELKIRNPRHAILRMNPGKKVKVASPVSSLMLSPSSC